MYDKMYWPTLKIILYMEKEFFFQDVFNSNFEPILHNGSYNPFEQDLFPGVAKNGFLTFIYILYIYVYIYVKSNVESIFRMCFVALFQKLSFFCFFNNHA